MSTNRVTQEVAAVRCHRTLRLAWDMTVFVSFALFATVAVIGIFAKVAAIDSGNGAFSHWLQAGCFVAALIACYVSSIYAVKIVCDSGSQRVAIFTLTCAISIIVFFTVILTLSAFGLK